MSTSQNLPNGEIQGHLPVLLKESLEYLNIQKGKIYVDCTLGTGGHSLEILKFLNGSGMLIGIEQDPLIFEKAKDKLSNLKNCYLFNKNFLEIKDILNELKIEKITGGVLLDLGINSLQINDPKRGFSFQHEGPLDMRMNPNENLTAYELINHYKENDLADIIFKYGEERLSRRIARTIVNNRPIKTTKELASLIARCYPKLGHFRIHPATRTFQAIRIEVNKELEKLEQFLRIIQELILPEGRLTVISFHSLEDRIVKFFLKGNEEFKILTKKPIQPSFEETKSNPRARSAKLRAAEKINNGTNKQHQSK